MRIAVNQWVGAVSNSDDCAIHIEFKVRSLLLNRTAPAGSIRLAQLHLHAFQRTDLAVLIPVNLHRIAQEAENNAFLFRMVDLLVTGRHFLLTAAVDNINVFRTQPFCCSGSIHRDISAADNRNVLRADNRCVVFRTVGLHQIDAREKFICGVGPNQALARYAHKIGQSCAATNKDRLKAHFKELVYRKNLSNNHVGVNGNPSVT